MPKFAFVYHGGTQPDTPEAGQKEMEKWIAWFTGMGAAVIDGGNPVGMSKTVSASGVANNGGPNPVSGISFVQAADIDAAVKLAKGCPIIASGGSVEVAESIDM